MPDTSYDSKPTTAMMMDWRDQLKGQWNLDAQDTGTYQTQIDREQDAYFQRFGYQTPYGEPGVKTGSAPGDADAAMDALRPNGPVQVVVKPARNRKKYKDQADLLKRAALGIIGIWRKQKDLDMLIADQVLRRVGIARVMFDESLWPEVPFDLQTEPVRDPAESDEAFQERWGDWDYRRVAWEVQNRRKFPIIFERRDPRYTFWYEWRDQVLVVVESYQTSGIEAYAAFSRYDRAREILKSRFGRNAVVQIDEIWYDKWRCLLIDNMPIYPAGEGTDFDGIAEHGYPEIPYVIAPFRELPYGDAGSRFRGLLTNSLDLYTRESEMLTMHMTMMKHNAWRTFVGWTRDGREINTMPGQYISINQQVGEYLTILEARPVSPEVMQTAKDIQNLIMRNGAAQGPTTAEGTRSAQQVWGIESIRQRKLDTPRAALERMMERALALCFMQVEKMMQAPVTVPCEVKDANGDFFGEVTLKPSDINGYWDGFDVTFRRRLDPAQLEQATRLMALSNGKFMPKSIAQEMSGLTDFAQEWNDEMMDEVIESLPAMLEVAGAMRVKEYYGEDSWQFKTYMQMLQQSKMQAGAPGEGSPANPGGQATPNGMKGGPVTPKGPQGNLNTYGQTAASAKPPPTPPGSRS